jgi:ketosteroid isomerase-like protein
LSVGFCWPIKKTDKSEIMKYVKLLSLIAATTGIAIVSCSPSAEVRNTEIATQMFAAFNTHDWQKMNAFYSPDADYLDPAYGMEYVKKSPDEIVKKYSDLQKMFPTIHDEVRGMYASSDKVTVEFISTGSSGDSLKFKLPICAVLTFKDGKIISDATYYNNQ